MFLYEDNVISVVNLNLNILIASYLILYINLHKVTFTLIYDVDFTWKSMQNCSTIATLNIETMFDQNCCIASQSISVYISQSGHKQDKSDLMFPSVTYLFGGYYW